MSQWKKICELGDIPPLGSRIVRPQGGEQRGADIAIFYLCEHDDAKITQQACEAEGANTLLVAGDLGVKDFCNRAVAKVKKQSRAA